MDISEKNLINADTYNQSNIGKAVLGPQNKYLTHLAAGSPLLLRSALTFSPMCL